MRLFMNCLCGFAISCVALGSIANAADDEKKSTEANAVEAAKQDAAKDEAKTAKDGSDQSKEKTNGSAEKKVAKKDHKKVSVARFKLHKDYPEGTGPGGLFGEMQPHLRDLLGRLDKAAKDENLAGVILEVSNPEVGLGKMNELRSAISRLRKAGKRVYANLEFASNKDYLIATACDRIVMPESGILMVNGLRVELTFFKKLLDKLDVKAEMIQIGDFKGAGEPFTRSEMSPEFKKQFEAVIDNFYEQMVKTIADDRKLGPEEVKKLIDEGLLTPSRAKEAKMIDMVCYEDELRDQIKSDLKADDVVIEKDYGKKKVDTDFSGFSGFMKLMEAMMGVEDKPRRTRGEKIAIIYAVGPITSGESESGLFGDENVGSDTIVKAFRTAEQDKNVKAIILRVDSPGGSALASDLIWREITRSKKPIVASMGDIAASGGYYISMGAKKIVAEPGTLTGSIGVISGKIALKGLLNKVGITTDVIRRGKNSGALSPLDPFSPEEREAWLRVSKDIYGQFTSKAAKGRKMDPAKMQELAQGKLYSGQMALSVGLVDKVGTLDDAVVEAKTMAGLKAEDKVELLILPKPKSFFEQLFEGPQAEVQTRLLGREVGEVLKSAETLRKLFREPAVMLLPCKVEVK